MLKIINIKKYLVLSSIAFSLYTAKSIFASEDDANKEIEADYQYEFQFDYTELAKKNLMIGYFHNFPCRDGYRGGQANNDLELKDIPKEYNIVPVAFMTSPKEYDIPTFKPEKLSDKEFKNQVISLNKRGVAVIVSLGGANANIILRDGQQNDLKNEIIRLCETYGFNGLDIDLEQNSITAGDNPKVITEALKMVKDHYKKLGKDFLICMAPEFPYLQLANNKYKPYIDGLKDYYDVIAPQYYNQGGDGVWVDEINKWVSQGDDKLKKEFLYYLTDSIINGKRNYMQIPADKFAIGLPANVDAANNGYVINPEDVFYALDRLEKDGNPIRGIMTWSINWDSGFNNKKVPYNNEFIKRYGKIVNKFENTDNNNEDISNKEEYIA